MVDIVAEISGNHGGSLDRALRLISVAAYCGCDYAKFQLYRPEDMPDMNGDNRAMYEKLMVPESWLPHLFATARGCRIGLFASVFSVRAVETLLKFDVPYIKLASPESTRLSWDTYRHIVIACSQRPDIGLIVSTGVNDADPAWRLRSTMMYCPPGHPAQITWDDYVNFKSRNYAAFSDHTRSGDYWTALRFIERGAQMIEKHLKVDDDCIDAAFSADADTMSLLCRLAHK